MTEANAAASVSAATESTAGSKNSNQQQAGGSNADSDDLPKLSDAQVERLLKSRKHRAKVAGQVHEVDYDELVRGYGHMKHANERLQQAAEQSKSATAIVNAVEEMKRGNHGPLIKLVGKDAAIRIGEQVLSEHIEYEELSPAEKRAIEAERRAAAAEAKIKKAEEAERAEAQNKAKAAALEEIDTSFSQALAKIGRKPTPRLLLRMAEDQYAYLSSQPEDSNVEPIKADRVVERALKELEKDVVDFTEGLSAPDMLRLFPKACDALRKHFASAARDHDPLRSSRQQRTDSAASSSDGKTKQNRGSRVGSKDWWNEREKRYGG